LPQLYLLRPGGKPYSLFAAGEARTGEHATEGWRDKEGRRRIRGGL